MSGIQAIPTRYKGFHFRSRLEARWAVAFDHDRIEWNYEAEGYNVNGTNYLPDFELTSIGAFVEIKPENSTTLPTIYMAGKMGYAENWRRWRPADIPDIYLDKTCGVYLLTLDQKVMLYSGPYGDGADNHSILHGQNDGYFYEEEILKRSLEGIERCSHFWAVLDTVDAYGTIAEIGYAKAIGKKICIVSHVKEGDDKSLMRELWFALKCADHYEEMNSPDYMVRAMNFFCEKSNIPVMPEVSKIRDLAKLSNKGWAIFYGQPGENGRLGHRLFSLSEGAVHAARSARFEHGYSGAS